MGQRVAYFIFYAKPVLTFIISLISFNEFPFNFQLLRVDYDVNSNAFPAFSDYSNQIIATHFMLVFDIFLYLALMIYFEKILPSE